MKINTETKLIGLIGYPLGHSFSPLMQNAAFERYLLNKIYIPIEVSPENLETVVKGISKMNFDGFNVTIPYKIDIIKYLDEIDEYAKCIGAVNTVSIKNGVLKGYNTDGIGFLKSYKQNTGTKIEGKKVFVLGSGGASRAVSMTLALDKADKIYICNRTYEKALALSNDINEKVGECSVAVPFFHEDMKTAIDDSDILINTTNVGMFPNIDFSPIDKDLLNEKLTVCDVVYNPKKTKLLQEAEEIGCETVFGLSMLLYQGAEAFEIWTEKKAPVDLMLKILEDGLKEN
ncbi:MAG: shikimate dehydrogenase [Sedimentibacter sp.]|uniref:shikimate dehydrogenase n=1 Tax=Sedimentibacter sp. TaxID=1960295 RepID=UPI002980A985|nr:shikimate dehydrogenase [Sedimentibacter sp.]MDW5299704.1 shikimate dehydrogenase [Sedimentibacter sp.]